MKLTCRCLALFVLLTAIPGCGDSPDTIVHDILVFWNEVCDNMLRATDEPTAKDLLAVQFKQLEEKHKSFEPRIKKITDNMKTFLEAKELDNALVDHYYEMKATDQRIRNTQKLLDKLIADTRGDTSDTMISCRRRGIR